MLRKLYRKVAENKVKADRVYINLDDLKTYDAKNLSQYIGVN